MFADRFGNSPSELNAQWLTKLALDAGGLPILDLTQSNPTTVGLGNTDPVGPWCSIPALIGQKEILQYSPTPKGRLEPRKAISRYYQSRNRTLNPDDIILTSSTSEAYSFLFKLLCNPGDEVLVPSPSYPLFDTLAELENVQLVRYRLNEKTNLDGTLHAWETDFNFLQSQISTRCKALLLVNPNNPTGHLCSEVELTHYLKVAADYNLALIMDEVFCDYLHGHKPFIPLVSEGPLVFTLNGFSKMLGLPQLKLGWIHVAGNRPLVEVALSHLEGIADAFLSVNTPVQVAAADLLSLAAPIQSKLMSRLSANLSTAEKKLMPSRCIKMIPPEAGWSLILTLDIPLSSESFALNLLEKYRVQVHGGHLFGFKSGCQIVLSLLGPEEEFARGLDLIIQCGDVFQNG